MNVGDRVTLKVRNPNWPRRHVYASYVDVPEFYTYTGSLVAPHKRDPEDTVRITSDDPAYPVRLIGVDRIEAVELA